VNNILSVSRAQNQMFYKLLIDGSTVEVGYDSFSELQLRIQFIHRSLKYSKLSVLSTVNRRASYALCTKL